MEVSRLGHA